MQTDANVGSFDAGYGSGLLARQIGQKRAREIFFLAREYSAEDAERWGVVNEVADHDDIETLALEYAAIIATKSPQAIRMLKYAFNLADDGLAGQQVFAGEATRMAVRAPRLVLDRGLELRDGGEHRQHGTGLLPRLDTCAGNHLRPILALGKMLFFGKPTHHGKQPRQFLAPIRSKIVRHALDHVAFGNSVRLFREGGPAEARRQRLIDCLHFLNQ